MDLTNIKNIVFDLGGVIFTLDRDGAVQRFKSAGLDRAEELLDAYHQKGIFLELEEGKLSKEEFYEALKKEAGKDIPNEAIDWGWMGFVADCPEYKLKMLEDLKAKGYKLYLLSNTNPIVMSWALSPGFSPSGKSLDQYFDNLYLSYKMGYTKPNPKIFHDMIQDSGMIPTETLFIDDGEANIKAAQELGFRTYKAMNGEDFRHVFRVES